MAPFDGIRVISTALNLPGPIACQHLLRYGARIIKVEPKDGDPLAHFYPDWYHQLHRGLTVLNLDLRNAEDRGRLEPELANADVLLTASRPKNLAALGLDWTELNSRFPRLCWLGILAYPAPRENVPGHDLNLQGLAGLVLPPDLPRTPITDLVGAERAVHRIFALLRARDVSGKGQASTMPLLEVAEDVAKPWRMGATKPGGPVGGGLASYGLYETQDGWVALAALESHLQTLLMRSLELPQLSRETLTAVFREKNTDHWERWGRENGIPLTRVR